MRIAINVFIGLTFFLSGTLKAVNVYSFAQTINSFCGLLGLSGIYGCGTFLAIVICTIEYLLPLLSLSDRYKDVVIWTYPVVLGYFAYITFINYTDPYGGIESCGCFGEVVHFSPAASFYKNVILLGLSLLLLAARYVAQDKAFKPGFPRISVDGYLCVALLASIAPPLFSFLCLNKMPHTAYLVTFIALCVVSIGVCILIAKRKPL